MVSCFRETESALKAGQKADAQKYLADALKYEGDTMGHCVGGYTPDVVSGTSRIFSLRDSKNEPHVTVEVQPSREGAISPQEFYNSKDAPPSLLEKITQAEQAGKLNTGNIDALVQNSPEYKTYLESRPTTQAIKQIKGKGNAKPKKDYLPLCARLCEVG